jgi:MarR family transcriptional regulator, organic hydroperoxide resistance regulator
MENESIDLEKTVSYLFAQVTTGYRNRLEKKMDEIGLHSGQVFVLFELWKKDGQTQINLAKSLNVAAPTVNKMLKGLADNGFVRTGKDEDDARSTRAYLDDRGWEVRELIEDQWRKLEKETLAGLTEAEGHILYLLLAKLRDHYFGRV